MVRIDAMGKDCPQPVMMTRAAADNGAGELEVIVDNQGAVSNVEKYLRSRGYETTRAGAAGRFTVYGRKTGEAVSEAAADCTCSPEAPGGGDYAVLILAKTLGSESPELGDVLMKAFLGTLAQRKDLPRVVALMNGGVFLALPEHSTCDTLKEMEAKGVTILVCGTCAKHFGVTDVVGVGSISNMFEITEAVFAASKNIVIG